MDVWKTEAFTGNPALWKFHDRKTLPTISPSADMRDMSGVMFAKLRDGQHINQGTFGNVRRYKRMSRDGQTKYIALKRPMRPEIDLYYEAMFQARLHEKLKDYSLEKAVPEVLDIVKLENSDTVWFTMEYIPGVLLSTWATNAFQQRGGIRFFVLMLLQLSLILEVFETGLNIDHRDLKVDNILIVEEPIQIPIQWHGKRIEYWFPFRVVCIDFGFSCLKQRLDVREGLGEAPHDFCPKEGRDIFQILVSLWNMKRVRDRLERTWGAWVRERISKTTSPIPCLEYTENRNDIFWLSAVTDDLAFRAPLCAPKQVIEDCFCALEKLE